MPFTPLNADTSSEVEAMQIEGWRQMSSDQKAALVTALTASTIEIALAGVRHRHPAASEGAIRFRLAEVLLGPTLARAAFPDLADTP